MSLDLVLMFVSLTMIVCGLVLLLVSKGRRKAGYFFMILGIIILIICLIRFPYLREHTFNRYQMVE